MSKRFVILGNGISGLTAAETIRATLPDASITMVTEEMTPTYARPLLSKNYLKTLKKEQMLVYPLSWYKEHNIELLLGCTVTGLNCEAHQVSLADGTLLNYDKLVYALGCKPWMPPYEKVPQGVFTVRTMDDIYKIHRYTAVAKNIVVIGGGIIGLEIAWELKYMCPSVTVLELAPRLMSRQLDVQSAGVITAQINGHGVGVHTGVNITGFEYDENDNVTGVVLKDGRVFPADLVIVSAGNRSQISLAQQAGLACNRGVIVDDYMQTSDPDIYAAGDCMECTAPNPQLWGFSKASAKVAGHNACETGERESFVPVASDILIHAMGTALLSTGYVSDEEGIDSECEDFCKESETLRINKAPGSERHYEKRFYKNGKLCGAVLIGNLSHIAALRAEIKTNKGEE